MECEWCGRPEKEQALEPVVMGPPGPDGFPMMLCEECREMEA